MLHSDGILVGYSDIEHSNDTGEPIDLKQYSIEVESNKPKHRYSFSLVSVEDRTFRLEFIAASCKEAVEWLVSIGQKTANFSVLKEQEMVNIMLEQFEDETAKRPSNDTLLVTRKRSSSLKSYFKAKFDTTVPDKRTEKKWLEDMKEQPDNKVLAVNYLTTIYEKPMHPLGQLVIEVKELMKVSIKSSTVDDLPKIVADVNSFAERIITNSVVHYRALATNYSAEVYYHSAFFEAFFPGLYDDFFALYKVKYQHEDELHSKKVGTFLTISPGHLAIKKKFWLSLSDQQQLSDDWDLKPAYHVAITTLKKLPFYHTPSRKVACLVATANAVVEAVRLHYHECKDEQDITVSADDLLPIFTYVMIKANVSNFCSEVAFVCDFLSDYEAQSVEGYTIVTVQTCVSFIGCLEESELSQNAAQLFEKITLEQKLRSGSQEIPHANNLGETPSTRASGYMMLHDDITVLNGDVGDLSIDHDISNHKVFEDSANGFKEN